MSSRRRALLSPRFYFTVLKNFFSTNSGTLLCGSVAFYTLVSLIPLIGLMLAALSTVVDVSTLSRVVASQLSAMFPGDVPRIMHEVQSFVDHRNLASGVGLLSVFLFGTQAFGALESAMAVIFKKRRERVQRHYLTSLLIPYLYIGALCVGLFIVTGATVFLEWAGARVITVGPLSLDLGGPVALVFPVLRVATEALFFTSLYLVFPGGLIKLKHALFGGLFAVLMWETARRILVWYYLSSRLSVVSVVYGSLVDVFVALIAMQTAAMIVLLSAQIIAEYEAIDRPAQPS